jgi:hypothetical protein
MPWVGTFNRITDRRVLGDTLSESSYVHPSNVVDRIEVSHRNPPLLYVAIDAVNHALDSVEWILTRHPELRKPTSYSRPRLTVSADPTDTRGVDVHGWRRF